MPTTLPAHILDTADSRAEAWQLASAYAEALRDTDVDGSYAVGVRQVEPDLFYVTVERQQPLSE